MIRRALDLMRAAWRGLLGLCLRCGGLADLERSAYCAGCDGVARRARGLASWEVE